MLNLESLVDPSLPGSPWCCSSWCPFLTMMYLEDPFVLVETTVPCGFTSPCWVIVSFVDPGAAVIV